MSPRRREWLTGCPRWSSGTGATRPVRRGRWSAQVASAPPCLAEDVPAPRAAAGKTIRAQSVHVPSAHQVAQEQTLPMVRSGTSLSPSTAGSVSNASPGDDAGVRPLRRLRQRRRDNDVRPTRRRCHRRLAGSGGPLVRAGHDTSGPGVGNVDCRCSINAGSPRGRDRKRDDFAPLGIRRCPGPQTGARRSLVRGTGQFGPRRSVPRRRGRLAARTPMWTSRWRSSCLAPTR
jgi:hypothetical protein